MDNSTHEIREYKSAPKKEVVSEFKGTMGEWYLQEYTDAYTHIIRCDNGEGFKTLYIGSVPQYSGEEARNNARLMAASKDLLEALQLAASLLRLEGWRNEAQMKKMDKAINKALKGESAS